VGRQETVRVAHMVNRTDATNSVTTAEVIGPIHSCTASNAWLVNAMTSVNGWQELFKPHSYRCNCNECLAGEGALGAAVSTCHGLAGQPVPLTAS
jgi:hypothetical protein